MNGGANTIPIGAVAGSAAGLLLLLLILIIVVVRVRRRRLAKSPPFPQSNPTTANPAFSTVRLVTETWFLYVVCPRS